MDFSSTLNKPIYRQIRLLVCQIPPGQVATYGQIASYLERCSARMVGYAMAGLPKGSNVPWFRVVNSKGQISPRGNAESSFLQRELLEEEGVVFRPNDSIDLQKFIWAGPSWQWLATNTAESDEFDD